MSDRDDDASTRQCPACGSVVPAASFCGQCGARRDTPAGKFSALLRPRVYATAHDEPVWLPRISSTMFPRFPARIRKPFRLGLILVLVLILVLGALRVNGPLDVTATIGWPLLFLLYVWQSDGFRDIPWRVMAVAMVLGVGLGVVWWLAAARVLAGSYGVSASSSLALTKVLDVGLVVTLGASVLMLAPAIVGRLLPAPARESLDGFVVGAFGALWFSTAASTTIIGPQFAEGLIEEQTAGRMLQDGITYGIVSPLVTVASGGLFGLSLWFRPDRRPARNPERARMVLTVCTLVGFFSNVSVWVVDDLGLPRLVDLALKLSLAALAVLMLRCGVQIALLHEAPEPATGDPVLCVHCETVVPDMPFCSSCGAAAQASSRTSRRVRREHPPVPVQTDPDSAP